MKIISLSTIVAAAAVVSACGGNTAPSNDRRANTVAPVSTANNSAPPTNVQTATTPANVPVANVSTTGNAIQPKNSNASTAPERPRVVEEKKVSKSATQPSNSIPSDDEMRKAFSKPVTKEEVNNPGMRKSEPMMKSKSSDVPMMKSTRKPSDKP